MVQTIWQENSSDYTQEKKKLPIVQYINYSNCVSISSCDQGQIGIKLERKHVYTKRLQVLHRNGRSMLTGLKVFSLTCKCVFYGPELIAKAGPHGIDFCKP